MSAGNRHVVYRSNTSWEVWEHDGDAPIAVCTSRANAHRLAAAPELLALVRRYAGMHQRATGSTGGNGYCDCKVCDDTRAALKKAGI
jgi:hypothetical protein